MSPAQEDREGILQRVESLRGVEAYMEPRTAIHPLSMVLVAEDGEWTREGGGDRRAHP